MKLLFDENLSPKLVPQLADIFPDSRHVEDCGLGSASDSEIWGFASDKGFAIVSKDSDFYERSIVLGAPPKIIWLRAGNSSTVVIKALLSRAHEQIEDFKSSPESALILLPQPTRKR